MSKVEQIADAILYEGYILYPYRASSLKNVQRWNFGVLHPPAYAQAQRGADASKFQCECLASGQQLDITVRFLQLVTRDRLDSNGNLIHSWQEAVTRGVEVSVAIDQTPVVHPFEFPASLTREPAEACEIVRRHESIAGTIEIGSASLDADWRRLRIRISNTATTECSTREAALSHSLVSTHAILRMTEGRFASLLDPPDDLRAAAAGCVNAGLWPVLAGDSPETSTMLASPIILYDYPQIAPQSAGALFDGTEIDEILSLRILALTEDEKREMCETDPQARRILERTESLRPEQWMQLHGMIREVERSR